MAEQLKCIGGFAHGVRRVVEDGRKFVEMNRMVEPEIKGPPLQRIEYEHAIYTRRSINVNGSLIQFLAPDGMPDLDALRTVLT